MDIDAKQLCEQAVANAQPGEDLDESLLRQCKAMYPDEHAEVYSAVSRGLEMMAEQQGKSKEQAVRDLAEGDTAFTIRQSTKVVSTEGGNLDDLPTDVRAKIMEAVQSGQGGRVTVSAGITGSKKMWRCKYCGHESETDLDICPSCGMRRRRGFLSWLFG